MTTDREAPQDGIERAREWREKNGSLYIVGSNQRTWHDSDVANYVASEVSRVLKSKGEYICSLHKFVIPENVPCPYCEVSRVRRETLLLAAKGCCWTDRTAIMKLLDGQEEG